MRKPLWIALLVLAPLAHAGDDMDFEESAKQRMKLSYDVDQVQGMLAQAPAPARAQVGVQAKLPLAPNSAVDTVTVFPDRALVTRVRTLELPAGASSVSFEGLPLGIAAESLHVDLRAGEVTVLGVERTSGSGDVAETEATGALREEAKGLADELGKVRDRIAALLAQRAYLRATLMQDGEDQPQPALPLVKGTLEYIGQAEAELAARLRVEEERAAELDKKLRPLLLRLEDREATGATVHVEVESAKASKVTLALSYQVFGAGWTPAYNARLADGQVELSYFGIVTNQTGDTWKDAALFLSTANPSISGELPELGAWTLGRYDSGLNALESGAGRFQELSNVQRAQAPLQQAAGDGGFSTTRASGGTVLFAIPGRRTVAGDGSQQRLPVGARSFPVVVEYATTPKLVAEVYRRGRLKYTGDAPLLPGMLSTFVGGDYVGSASIDTVTPGEELLLSLGTDDRFKVERTLISRELDHPGAGRKTVRYTFHYRITVTNFGDKAERVMVTDQVPVSETDRVTVKMLETTPPRPPSEDDPPGVMRWALELAPRQSVGIDLRFSVTGPADGSTAMEYQELEMAY